MSGLKGLMSGKAARMAQIQAANDAEAKRQELGQLNVPDEEQQAIGRTRQRALQRSGRASTRLSDSILGGSAPLG